MARENLAVSLDLMFGHEGGYVNVKSDRGGPTKYGITHKTLAAHRGVSSVTASEVKAMTKEEAEEIYRRSYWSQSGGDLLPSGLDYAAFDFGVNSGPATAAKKLQAVLQDKKVYAGAIDGHIGEQTVAAAAAVGARDERPRGNAQQKLERRRVESVRDRGAWRGPCEHLAEQVAFGRPRDERQQRHRLTRSNVADRQRVKAAQQRAGI